MGGGVALQWHLTGNNPTRASTLWSNTSSIVLLTRTFSRDQNERVWFPTCDFPISWSRPSRPSSAHGDDNMGTSSTLTKEGNAFTNALPPLYWIHNVFALGSVCKMLSMPCHRRLVHYVFKNPVDPTWTREVTRLCTVSVQQDLKSRTKVKGLASSSASWLKN